jgi:hypothetical protein
MRLCFSYDDTAIVHVAEWPPKHEQTLCGKRAFFTTLTRRRITCPVCVTRKREMKGGTTP